MGRYLKVVEGRSINDRQVFDEVYLVRPDGSPWSPDESGAATAQRTLGKMRRGVEDVSVLIPSDSTAVYSGPSDARWAYKWSQLMAGDWPEWTVHVIPWDDSAVAYGAPLVVQTGTGPRTLRVYVAAVSGSRMEHFLGAKFETAIGSIQPDLMLVNYGLNDGSTDVNGARMAAQFRILQFTETVAAACPQTSIIILTQNERLDVVNEATALRANRYHRAAEQMGYGLIDTRQAFLEDPRGLAALLKDDLLHPNDAGSQLIADTVFANTRYVSGLQPRLALPPCFTTVGGNLLVNGDFASFAAPPALPSWTTTGAPTLSKDTVNYEGPNGYSVRIQATAATQTSIYQDLNLAATRGQTITVAARVRVPTGQANTAGRVAIMNGDGAANDVTSIGINTARDGWQWILATKRIPANPAYTRVRVYGDTASNATADVSVDRVIAVKGALPRDLR